MKFSLKQKAGNHSDCWHFDTQKPQITLDADIKTSCVVKSAAMLNRCLQKKTQNQQIIYNNMLLDWDILLIS